MPNEQGRFNRQEVLESGLPYFIPRTGRWNGGTYPFAVLLSKTRCRELGVPIMENGEQPSAFLYAANAGSGTSDNQHRYYPLFDRTDAYKEIKDKLYTREIMECLADKLSGLSRCALTKEQINQMEHALGLHYKKKPSRNYYYCNGDDPSWSDLVEKGFATRSDGWTEGKAYFRLTFEGAKVIFTKPMSRQYFDELP